MAKKLYVGNLSFDTDDAELEQAFSTYGEVISAVVVKDRDTNRSRGFGFVEFAQDADAQKAKEAMNGAELAGRTLKVDDAKEPRSRDRGGDRGRSGGYGSNRRSRY
jgi:RNA recognition motif-containing protein